MNTTDKSTVTPNDTSATAPSGCAALSHDDLRRRQEAVLRHLIDLLATDPHVLGLSAGGSYVRGTNDGFSDLDLHCYLRDEERTRRHAIHEWVSALAPTLSVLYLYDRQGLYLFEDGVRLDLSYEPPSAVPLHLHRAGSGARSPILLDPDGVLAQAHGRDPEYGPEHRAHPRWWQAGDPAYVTWFLWMFRQIYGWTKRGAQGGERALSKLFSTADSVHQVRSSLAEMRLWTLNQPFNLAAADPELAADLARTYPHLVPDELLGATLTLLAAYERICPDYCAKAGVHYPAEKIGALHQVLDEFDRLQ
jgi:hypothetical protein